MTITVVDEDDRSSARLCPLTVTMVWECAASSALISLSPLDGAHSRSIFSTSLHALVNAGRKMIECRLKNLIEE